MSEPVTVPKPVTACPDCGCSVLAVVARGGFVECLGDGCSWTCEPAVDLVIAAAVETYRRAQ